MNKIRAKIAIFVASIFILANVFVTLITERNMNEIIKAELKSNINNLKIHFEVLQHHQRATAKTVMLSTLAMPKVKQILQKAKSATPQRRVVLREQLYNILKNKYKIMKIKDVLQYQFVLPTNESFLRMHKPSKFGDNLENIREDIKLTNETKEAVSGFVQGRVAHGFRNVFPVFNDDKEYLGAMEVSYSSDSLQNNLSDISKIHTHFLVDKSIFDKKTWDEKDLVVKYAKSLENVNLLLTINSSDVVMHHHEEEKNNLKSLELKIAESIKKNKEFALYKDESDEVTVLTFLPIKDLTNTKVLAWLVAYQNSDEISRIINIRFIVRAVSFMILLILFIFLFIVLDQRALLNRRVAEKTKENVDQMKMLQQQKKMATMGEMMDAVAHQWKQPLNIINIKVDMLGYDFEDNLIDQEYVDKFKAEIFFQSEHMTNTLDEFRSFFRPNQEVVKFDVKNMIQKTIHLVKDEFMYHQVNITVEVEKNFHIVGIENEIKHIILNIINNAKDAFNEKNVQNREIRIDILANKSIEITDNAGGIPKNIINDIFKPNFTTKSKSNGTGIGLFMSLQIAEKYNATLEVENVENGAKFTFKLC
ncbi:MAG: hypothetical protein GQ570_11325 [Helicobacteraceae bacterium]|nr:hypothetical protein [Helicobacteraceae bacterium]